MTAATVEPWAWPPTPTEIVAGATLALAIVTAILALVTQRMARAARQEVAAQWRPALIPGKSDDKPGLQWVTPAIWVFEDTLKVAIYNAGSGPAMNIQARFLFDYPTNAETVHARDLRDAQVILPGEQRFLDFPTAVQDVHGRLYVSCSDLAGFRFLVTMSVHTRTLPRAEPAADIYGNDVPPPTEWWFDDYKPVSRVGRWFRGGKLWVPSLGEDKHADVAPQRL